MPTKTVGRKRGDYLMEEKQKEYKCPMHPEVTSDKPGSCPKCGMDLVSEEEGKDEE